MGASEWHYVTDYTGDLDACLTALHHTEFHREGSPFRKALDRWGLPQPTTLDELWRDEYNEFLANRGTHSILDIPSMEDITPLDAAETLAAFDVEHPTRADWDRATTQSPRGGVAHLVFERWSGRCVLLYRDGEPREAAFWGYSGD